MAMRVVSKLWSHVVYAFIDYGVKSGEMIVHGGKDISHAVAYARREGLALVTRVIFLLNITKVREKACWDAVNLVVVDIPEGVESIGDWTFHSCRSLTTVSFPTTLKLIDAYAFYHCISLDNVDLLHTNLQK